MEKIETGIEGLFVIKPRVFEDARGYFFECYNQASFAAMGIDNVFIQDNQSKSTYGVVRGLHCQADEFSQAKLVRCLEGKVLDVAVDVREGSPTYGKSYAVELSADNQLMFMIPRGFLHGFAVLSESAIFSYKCDNLYKPSSERGINPYDTDLAIDWKIPQAEAVLSDKDLQAPSFSTFAPLNV